MTKLVLYFMCSGKSAKNCVFRTRGRVLIFASAPTHASMVVAPLDAHFSFANIM
jgi:hypothetical protein